MTRTPRSASICTGTSSREVFNGLGTNLTFGRMTTYAHRYIRPRYSVRALALAAVLAVALGGLGPAADAAPKTANEGATSPRN